MSTINGEAPKPAPALAELSRSFDHAPWAVTELFGEAHIVRYANSAFCKLLDKARDEVVGTPIEKLLPADECLALLDRVFRSGTAVSFTAEVQAPPFPLLFSYHLWPVKAEGRTAGVMIQVSETGPLHETRQAISQALLLGALRQDELIEAAESAKVQLQTEIGEGRQREDDAKLLANEVAHRVKNNLQIVAALIANEIRRTTEPCIQGYRAMQDRIMAIASLYDLISQTSRDRDVHLDAYLSQIARSLSASLLGGASCIRILVEAEALTIDAERAVPFGLLVNELSTNAVKRAFPGGAGLVKLSLRRIQGDIELSVIDDGIGMADQNERSTHQKHGSDYVAILFANLEAALSARVCQAVGLLSVYVFRCRRMCELLQWINRSTAIKLNAQIY